MQVYVCYVSLSNGWTDFDKFFKEVADLRSGYMIFFKLR